MSFTSSDTILETYLKSGSVSIDSRQIKPGALFFAIRGERFDGNDYALAALEQGALAAVVDNPAVAEENECCMLVPHALKALQELANTYRHRFSVPVIGITGSNGKTTTKELVAAVLAQRYKTHYTGGNFNNHIGVPLTLLRMPMDTEMAVIEMGANAQGEIALLSSITDPDYGLITNIGKAHLEGFGGIEGVKKGKSELYRHLEKRGGTAFINTGERFLEDLSEGVPRRIRYRLVDELTGEAADYVCTLVSEKPFLRVAFLDQEGNRHEVTSQLFGRYNANNIVTAVALGLHFGVDPGAICKAIAGYQPGNNRSQILKRGTTTFLLDAYNANPTSLENALRYLASLETGERKVAVIGDMLELGEDSDREHRAIAQLAKQLALDEVIFIGSHFAEPARETGYPHFADVEELKPWFDRQDWSRCRILLKASRRLQLEQLI